MFFPNWRVLFLGTIWILKVFFLIWIMFETCFERITSSGGFWSDNMTSPFFCRRSPTWLSNITHWFLFPVKWYSPLTRKNHLLVRVLFRWHFADVIEFEGGSPKERFFFFLHLNSVKRSCKLLYCWIIGMSLRVNRRFFSVFQLNRCGILMPKTNRGNKVGIVMKIVYGFVFKLGDLSLGYRKKITV